MVPIPARYYWYMHFSLLRRQRELTIKFLTNPKIKWIFFRKLENWRSQYCLQTVSKYLCLIFPYHNKIGYDGEVIVFGYQPKVLSHVCLKSMKKLF
jgi:hypothetical protein